MDILGHILISVVGGAAAQVGQGLYHRMRQFFNDYFKDTTDKEILQTLEEIGNLSEADIRKRVDELSRLKQLPPDQAEELAVLLINLAHGMRFHTTHGTPHSSFVRCERLIEQLLTRILPKRRREAPVAENAMPGWKLTRFLGIGGFGEVWEAQNTDFPEPKAIKFFTSPDAKEWVKAEQKTLYHVQGKLPKHPNLISFLDVDKDGKPFPYLVLEFANGGSLEEWILKREKERPKADKRMLVEGIIRGLAAAHEQGIAHRDLKPANILLSVNDKGVLPKIGDFGLGRVEVTRADKSTQTNISADAGTTMYMPPEAMQRFAKREFEQDDVFAVGVIWYQLIVGQLERPPYDFAERLREHLADSQTIRVIERCLAHPNRRFKDASELEFELNSKCWVPDRDVPVDCFDVQYIGREYLASKS